MRAYDLAPPIGPHRVKPNKQRSDWPASKTLLIGSRAQQMAAGFYLLFTPLRRKISALVIDCNMIVNIAVIAH